jgi:hypothetical protein
VPKLHERKVIKGELFKILSFLLLCIEWNREIGGGGSFLLPRGLKRDFGANVERCH